MRTVMQKRTSSSIVKDKEDFLEELEREIARVRRYGHRVTLLLIEPEEALEDAERKKFEQEILNQLRTSDCAYHYGENQYAALLPDTHEAGGEAAALRLKRRICSAMNRKRANELVLSIGVMSLDAGISKDIPDILHELERDLERDRKCQGLDDATETGAVEDSSSSDVTDASGGEIIFAGCDDLVIENVKRLCGDKFVARSVEPSEVLSIIEDRTDERGERPVLVLGPQLVLSEKRDVTQKIRFNRKLGNIYIVWVQDESLPVISSDEPDLPCDILLPSMPEPELLWPIIRYGFNAVKAKYGCEDNEKLKGMLDAISVAAHKLNQPLQIILGRLELLMLNLDDTPENKELLEDIKTIRSQALLASDINKKIGRLSKY